MHEIVVVAIGRIPESAWQPVPDYPDSGICELAETTLGGRRLVVRRVHLHAQEEHNLQRWVGQLGLKEGIWRAPRTMRRWLLVIPGRLTRTARRWSLHLPARWPWRVAFVEALTRIRALPSAA